MTLVALNEIKIHTFTHLEPTFFLQSDASYFGWAFWFTDNRIEMSRSGALLWMSFISVLVSIEDYRTLQSFWWLSCG